MKIRKDIQNQKQNTKEENYIKISISRKTTLEPRPRVPRSPKAHGEVPKPES